MRTQIIIKDTQVDLLQEVSLNINRQLVDIQNPGGRKTDRTLTIDIPGSPANDKLFNYIFEVNIDLNADDTLQEIKHFNPYKKVPVVIYIDSIEQLKGYCQLTDVVINSRDKISYKIVCYGEIGDLFAKIDNQEDEDGNPLKAELTDLDFSEFDHTYNRTNIANSWDTSIVVNNSAQSFELGKGYVYPMIDYGFGPPVAAQPARWKTGYFKPAVYVKQYVDKIFEKAGYTYTSDFFNSELFKRLIVPFNSDKFILTQEEVSSRLFYVNRNGTDFTAGFLTDKNTPSSAQPIVFNTDSSPYFDNGSDYDTSTGKFICDKSGYYKFYTSVKARLKYTGSATLTSGSIPGGVVLPSVGIFIKNSGIITPVQSSRATVILNFPVATNDITDYFTIAVETNNLLLQAGDEIFTAPLGLQSTLNWSEWEMLVAADGATWFANSVPDAAITEGGLVTMNSCIPAGIKQRDFMGSVIKAFNLYMEPNPDKTNDFIIEPREDYYTGEAVDWTNKLDLSKEFIIQPVASDTSKYKFSYAPDEDILNKSYKELYDRSYGDFELRTTNEFARDETKVELIFAPTPSFKDENNPTDRIIPYIGFFDQKGEKVQKSSRIRWLYYGGLKGCDKWNFEATGVSAAEHTSYPYSGHLDDPYVSNFDLNFAPPVKVLYSSPASRPINYTNQNLFSLYWYPQVTELTDLNSRIVEGWFYLAPADMYKLSFRNYYFIKDAYYRLLKIENYDPVNSNVTKCQFLKVLEFDAPLQVRTTLNGGRRTFGVVNKVMYDVPGAAPGTVIRTGDLNAGGSVILGADNTLGGGATTVLVAGSSNYVFSGSERVTIAGGLDNTVLAGLTDITIINSNGVTAAEPCITYINNQRYYTTVMGAAINIADADSPFMLDDSIRTVFADSTGGDITVKVPTAGGRAGKIFEIIRISDDANVVTISAASGEAINGDASVDLTTAYDKIIVTSNGVNWYRLG